MVKYDEGKDRRQSTYGYAKLGDVVNEVTKPTFQKHGSVEAKLIVNWKIIVGTDVSDYTRPVRIAFPRDKSDSGGVLHLEVCGNMAIEVQHMEEQILERIAAHMGYRAVDRIKLVQNTQDSYSDVEIPCNETKETSKIPVEGVSDSALSSALAELEENI